jgi:uncharacterized OsmC-like protein
MTATATIERKPKRTPVPLNGVDTPTLLATIKAVGEQPDLAKFRFRARNEWVSGTHSRSVMSAFYGAGSEQKHKAEYTGESDHPAVLCGADSAPTPVEWVLHALASCLMAGVANVAAARGVTLKRVQATVEGDIDLRGILGLSNEVRNGYQNLRVFFEIDGDAPRKELEEIVMQSKARSAVFDIVSHGLPVLVTVDG